MDGIDHLRGPEQAGEPAAREKHVQERVASAYDWAEVGRAVNDFPAPGIPARFAVPGGIGPDGSMGLPDYLRPAIHPPYRDEPGDRHGPVSDMRNPLDKPPPDATASQLFDHLYAAMKTGDDGAFKQVLATVADADISRGFHVQAVATVDVQERQAILDVQERQQQQQAEQMEAQVVRVHGPSMH